MSTTKITTNVIADDAVTQAKIGDDAVGADQLASSAVVTASIVDLNVTTAKIAADAITGAKIADDTINSEHYASESIDTEHIADLNVTTAKIANDAITGAKIADDAIDSEHYADGSIDTAHIADDQVTLAKMAGLARGKIIYGDASGNPAALALGSNGTVLTSDGTDISWAASSGGLSTSGGTLTGNLTMGGMILKPNADGGSIGFNRNPDSGAHVGDSSLRRFQINGPDSTFGDVLQIQSYNSSGTHQGNLTFQDGNLTLGDDQHIYFGDATSDLDIYHIGGSVSVVRSTPALVIQSDDYISLGTYSDGELMLKATKNGAVDLYHDNVVKLSTAANGIGIGTTSPARPLHVKSSGTNIGSFEGSNGEGLVIVNNTDGRADIIGYSDTASAYNALSIRASANDAFNIDTGGRLTTPQQPKFGVARNAGYMTDDQVWVCDSVDTNVGSHYDSSNGKFTAPVAGTYFFTGSVMTHDSSGSVTQVSWSFRKNNSSVKDFIQHKINAVHCRVDGSIIMTLAANDFVTLFVNDSNTSSGWAGSQHVQNHFGGFLVG